MAGRGAAGTLRPVDTPDRGSDLRRAPVRPDAGWARVRPVPRLLGPPFAFTWLFVPPAVVAAVARRAAELYEPSLARQVTTLALVVVPWLLAVMAAYALVRRRWGAARFDGARFFFTLPLGQVRVVVALDDVVDWTVTPHGVLLEASHAAGYHGPRRRRRTAYDRVCVPLLVPTAPGPDTDALVALLDAPRGAPA